MLFYVIQAKLHRIAWQSDGAQATVAVIPRPRVRDNTPMGPAPSLQVMGTSCWVTF